MRSLQSLQPTVIGFQENKQQKSVVSFTAQGKAQDSFRSIQSTQAPVQFSGNADKPGFFGKKSQLLLLLATLGLPVGAAQAYKVHGNSHQEVAAATCEAPHGTFKLPHKITNLTGFQPTDGEGNPTRSAHIAISVPPGTELCKDDDVMLNVKVTNPTPMGNMGKTVFLPVDVKEMFISRNQLNIVFDGPVSTGSRLEIGEGTFLLANGTANKDGTVTLKSDNILTPDMATPWFKSLAPTDPNKSQFLSYGVSNSDPSVLQPTDFKTVKKNLRKHLIAKIKAGLLTPKRALEVYRQIDDPKVHKVFTDTEGVLNTHLMASTLSLAGTVLDHTMEVFLGTYTVPDTGVMISTNDTGMPAKVYYGEPSNPNFDAEVFITESGEMHVVIDKTMELVPSAITGTLFGHEALHQDNSISQVEEIIASVAQQVAYAQQLLVHPELAMNNFFSAHVNNTWLLTLINSGKAGYPNPGHEEASLIQDRPNEKATALPDGSSSPFMSFKDGRIQAFYSETPTGESLGNLFLDVVAQRIAGGNEEFSGLNFDEETLKTFDNIRALTPEQWQKVCETLQLSFDPNEMAMNHGRRD